MRTKPCPVSSHLKTMYVLYPIPHSHVQEGEAFNQPVCLLLGEAIITHCSSVLNNLLALRFASPAAAVLQAEPHNVPQYQLRPAPVRLTSSLLLGYQGDQCQCHPGTLQFTDVIYVENMMKGSVN